MKTLPFPLSGKAIRRALWLAAGLLPGLAAAQTTLVRGVVRSAATREPLPFVNVTVPGTTLGTTTGPDGAYALTVPPAYRSVAFSLLGYRPETRPVVPGRAQVVDVVLAETAQALPEVVVRSGRTRYRNKNNPAVELIRRVIDH